MKSKDTLKYFSITGWLVTATTIVLIALLLVTEENRSSYFWLRVIWSEVLCFLFWGGLSSYFLASARQEDSITRFGGIKPTVSIITTVYAILSFLVMAGHSYMENGNTSNRWHLIVQILLFSVTALTLIFLSISRISAASNLAFDHSKAETPKSLHDLIAAHEPVLPDTSTTSRTKSALKNLRETITFSLSASSRLSDLPEYQALCNNVKTLCSSIEDLSAATEADSPKIASLGESAISLLNKTKLISAKQVRR